MNAARPSAMNAEPSGRVASISGPRFGRRWTPRAKLAAATLAVLLAAAGCGGGGDDGNVTFGVGVIIGGQPVSGINVPPGGYQTIYLPVGESIELDASEPVIWTVQLGGTAFAGGSTTVYYAGAYITQTALSASRIAIDTSAPEPLPAAIPMRLTATSTYDSALIATIDVWITN